MIRPIRDYVTKGEKTLLRKSCFVCFVVCLLLLVGRARTGHHNGDATGPRAPLALLEASQCVSAPPANSWYFPRTALLNIVLAGVPAQLAMRHHRAVVVVLFASEHLP